MNYASHYDRMIARARSRGPLLEYTERHHVLPRCLGGSDDSDNLVDLTAREHYLAHALLTKMYPDHRGIAFAFHMMNVGNSKQERYKSSHLYGALKKQLRSRRMSPEHRAAIGQAVRGLKRTAETKERIRASRLGTTVSEQARAKMSIAHKERERPASEYESRRGRSRPEHAAQMKEAMKGKHKGKKKYNDGVREYLCHPSEANPVWILGRLKR